MKRSFHVGMAGGILVACGLLFANTYFPTAVPLFEFLCSLGIHLEAWLRPVSPVLSVILGLVGHFLFYGFIGFICYGFVMGVLACFSFETYTRAPARSFVRDLAAVAVALVLPILGGAVGYLACMPLAWVAFDVFDLADPTPSTFGFFRLIFVIVWPVMPFFMVALSVAGGIYLSRGIRVSYVGRLVCPSCGRVLKVDGRAGDAYQKGCSCG